MAFLSAQNSIEKLAKIIDKHRKLCYCMDVAKISKLYNKIALVSYLT
jgi:hypothetical protein